MLEMKDQPKRERPEYLIVKDDRHEYLVKQEGGKRTFLLRAETREQLYDVILTDMYAPVYETTPGQMIEAAFGEPQWHYGDGFNPAPQAKRLFPEPPKPEPEPKPEKTKSARTLEGSLSPFCDIHKCEKYRDGKTNGGKQKYRCPECKKEEPRHHASAPRKGSRKVALKGNPKCETCGQRMRVRGQWRSKRYYRCPTCPPPPKGRRDSGEELTAFVHERVTHMNGHDPQMRDDIVQEIVTDIIGGKLKKEEVTSRKIKQYVAYCSRLQSNKYRDVSIDQPRGDDEGGLTLKDVLEG